MIRYVRLSSAAVLAGILLSAPAHAIDITACGQIVPAGETGILQVDLDCSSEPPSGHVVLGNRAVLELGGHAIVASSGSDAVRCAVKGCTVRGPGDISGGHIGINADRNLTVEDVTIHDVDYGLSAGFKGKLDLTNVHVTRAALHGVVGHQIRATNVSATDCGLDGIHALGRLRAVALTATGNGGAGVDASGPYRIDGLLATDNGQMPTHGGAGLYASRGGYLANAVVTGNAFSRPQLGSFLVDLFVRRRPRVTNVTCDRSRAWVTIDGAGDPLGICALD